MWYNDTSLTDNCCSLSREALITLQFWARAIIETLAEEIMIGVQIDRLLQNTYDVPLEERHIDEAFKSWQKAWNV